MPPILLRAGAGLDRDTGAASESPESYSDLRNVVHYERSVRLRGGLGASVETVTGESYVCYITVFKAAGKVIYVTYDAATGDVNVYEADLQGQNPVLVGAWGTLTAAAVPPQFTSAESFGILVLAHDEPDVTARLATYRYDPAAMTPWDDITADLDGLGAQPVKFRGVYQWLGYVFGWGFGTNSDPDRPEVIRSSSPDDPTVYNANHYFRAGERTSPVIGVQAVGSSLGVWKSSSWYRIDGDSRTNWTIQLVDPYVGLVSARAVLNVEGVAHWWSPQGPRMTTGGVTEDAGLVLDLTGNAPADLPTPGPYERIYALYYPELRHLVYHAPADSGGMLAWRANLRNPSEPSWAWWTFPRAFLHAAQVNADEVTVIEPGTASAVTASGSSGSGTASITVNWTHNNVVGDETIELWYETPGGVWSKLKEFAYGTVSGPTGTTTFTGGALVTGTGQVALRYRRSGRFATGYESSNPDDWPAAAKASVTIVVVATPVAITATYDFTNGDVNLLWTNGDAGQDIEVQLFRSNGVGTDVSAIVPLAAATTSYTFPWAASSVQDLCRLTGMQAVRNGAANFLQARVRHKVGGVAGTWTVSPAVTIAYDAAPGGASVVRDNLIDRTSVSLGTGTGLDVTLPSSVVADVVLDIWINANSYGAIPNNGGCGVTTDFGGGLIGYPNSSFVAWYSATYPLGTASPLSTGFIPAIACAQCNIVGQQVGMGLAVGTMSWRKVGDFADHGYGFTVSLPGNIGGLFTCGV